jgi:hypothetical protein
MTEPPSPLTTLFSRHTRRATKTTSFLDSCDCAGRALDHASRAIAPTSPPKGSKPLSEVLRPIEAALISVILMKLNLKVESTKLSTTQDGSKQKIHIVPLTGTEREAGPKR